jgi:hypothetical protein
LGLKYAEPLSGRNQISLLDWLESQRIFIQEAVQGAPRDTFELPGQLASESLDPRIEPQPEPDAEIEFEEVEEIPALRATRAQSQEQDSRARTEASRAERLELFQQNGFDAL